VKPKVVVFLRQLKSPMQIMMGVDAEQQAEMETMIHELEAENKFVILVAYYHPAYALWIVINSNLIFIMLPRPAVVVEGIVLSGRLSGCLLSIRPLSVHSLTPVL